MKTSKVLGLRTSAPRNCCCVADVDVLTAIIALSHHQYTALTMIQQQPSCGQMSLRSRHHQGCPTLLVDRVDVCPVTQQQLHYLISRHKTKMSKIRLKP